MTLYRLKKTDSSGNVSYYKGSHSWTLIEKHSKLFKTKGVLNGVVNRLGRRFNYLMGRHLNMNQSPHPGENPVEGAVIETLELKTISTEEVSI